MPTAVARPRFAFSRRDPTAILALADKRRRRSGGVRVLALGGQPRDRVYCAQLLASTAGDAFVHVDLALRGRTLADEKSALERLLAFARATPTTLCIDGAESVFEATATAPGERATRLGSYLKKALAAFAGGVVLGMPEKVDADYGRLPALDMEVTFRAPSGAVIAGSPLLLPSQLVDEELLPAHNFSVEIDGVEAGLCAVSAPRLLGGPFSDRDFSPVQGISAFTGLDAEQRAAWPSVTLRRGVTQSTLFYDWKQAQYAGKPLLRDVRIRQLDWPGRRVVNTWLLRDCWAKGWTGPAFDALQRSVAEESLELYYRDVVWR
ncbi:MAG: phage tail protein [Gammaproteobacteria bacterium]|nr:phage tail protein [Gammaproteobacteria bacterium]